MGHKGYYGQYTGNAKWSKNHADTKVTKSNYKASERDDAAHIDYLKRDVDYDNKHGHSDSSMTSDEKHISKLAGDMKYDKEHHGSPAKSIGAHSMKDDKYASHLASASEHKVPSDKERKGRKHASDTQPTNNPPAQMVSPLNEAAYFGLGPDDGKQRKMNKLNKTYNQIQKMQNERSSVKNTYLGDPDDLQGEMIRTADKPASRREIRKMKKFNKTQNQLNQ